MNISFSCLWRYWFWWGPINQDFGAESGAIHSGRCGTEGKYEALIFRQRLQWAPVVAANTNTPKWLSSQILWHGEERCVGAISKTVTPPILPSCSYSTCSCCFHFSWIIIVVFTFIPNISFSKARICSYFKIVDHRSQVFFSEIPIWQCNM